MYTKGTPSLKIFPYLITHKRRYGPSHILVVHAVTASRTQKHKDESDRKWHLREVGEVAPAVQANKGHDGLLQVVHLKAEEWKQNTH